jgi:tryptophanyl-tRNA synthetase
VEEYQSNKYNIQKLKDSLASTIVERLSEIQRNMKEWSDDDVRQVLKEGSQKASTVAG